MKMSGLWAPVASAIAALRLSGNRAERFRTTMPLPIGPILRSEEAFQIGQLCSLDGFLLVVEVGEEAPRDGWVVSLHRRTVSLVS